MPSVRIGDVDLHYMETGSGEPVLLAMGLGGDHVAWGYQVRALAGRHRVVAFDNRGVGRTTAPDARYTIRDMAGDALGLLDALAIDRAHVIGVSMGGMIAQELALAHPERIRSLHLGCTLARPDGHMRALNATWRALKAQLPPETALRAIALWMFAPCTYDERPEFVEMVIQAALASPYPQPVSGFVRQAEAVLTHDTLERLADLRAPVLVSVGEDDMLVPPRFSRTLAAAIPGARLQLVPRAGHVYFWERADVFNALALEFIEAHRGA